MLSLQEFSPSSLSVLNFVMFIGTFECRFPTQWAFLSLLPPIQSPEHSFRHISFLQTLLSHHRWKGEGDWKKTMENETMFSYCISQNHPYSFCVVSSEWKKHILLECVFLGRTLPRLVWLQVVDWEPFLAVLSNQGNRVGCVKDSALFPHCCSVVVLTECKCTWENWDFLVLLGL